MELDFRELTDPTIEIAESFDKWENDPTLIPFIRPNKDNAALEFREAVTVKTLEQRLVHHHMYLIYLDSQLIGTMDYRIDPTYLYKKETGTAWLGILIGEEANRGKGIGTPAIRYLEEQIRRQELRRIELGVFEFNTNAIKLYQKLGYVEIARIDGFTFWQDKTWQDIRMEKYVHQGSENADL